MCIFGQFPSHSQSRYTKKIRANHMSEYTHIPIRILPEPHSVRTDRRTSMYLFDHFGDLTGQLSHIVCKLLLYAYHPSTPGTNIQQIRHRIIRDFFFGRCDCGDCSIILVVRMPISMTSSSITSTPTTPTTSIIMDTIRRCSCRGR